ncbi:MAG: hypothetical protein KDC45_13135 [Bacteroidetes bacterium]|nr:hypothetical protein [Bacteroidota bacterium]
MERFDSLITSLEDVWQQVLSFLPTVVVALLVLVAGWAVAKLLRKLAIRIMRKLRLDVASEKAGLEDFLIRGGVRFTAVTLIGAVIYWTILLVVILTCLNLLGLNGATELLNRIILYVPNVLIAVLVLISGSLFARFVQGLIFAYLNNVGMQSAELVGGLAYLAILVFVVSVALEQLAIGTQIIVSAFQIAFGGICLALALAFGLGGRDWAAGVIEKFSKKNGK